MTPRDRAILTSMADLVTIVILFWAFRLSQEPVTTRIGFMLIALAGTAMLLQQYRGRLSCST